jgi:hypothetical protein
MRKVESYKYISQLKVAIIKKNCKLINQLWDNHDTCTPRLSLALSVRLNKDENIVSPFTIAD